MQFKGRTVFILLALTIVLSSLITLLLTEISGLEGTQSPIYHAIQNTIDQTNGNEPNPSSSDSEPDFQKVIEAYELIRDHYVLEVDDEKLLEGAIEGMLNTLEDPYSVYMDPETAEQFKTSLSSSFEGIGAEVMLQDGRVTIVAPIRGAPAEQAGLRPNDQIISVNGESIEGMDLHQAVMKIRGPKGSEAVLEVIRPGVSDPMSVTVIRDEIPLQTVYTETIRANDKTFGLIEITSFAEKTASDFAEALAEFEQEGIEGLIIDVRGNPGGYLDAVRDIGQLIVPDENVITKIQSRDGDVVEYRSTLKGRKPYPITVLADNGSASASEILAAALQEAGNYKVVGETTFGKGTVQSTIELEDTSELKLTIAKWLTPNDNWLHQVGVEPDVKVEQPAYFSAVPIQPPLKRDMNSGQVQNLQQILLGLGLNPGREDGFYNAQTEQAVKTFQEEHSLPATGEVDEQTANALIDSLLEVIRDPHNDVQLQKAVEVLLQELD